MMLLNLVTGTPLWVWALLALIIYVGIKGLKNQTLFIPTLFLMPGCLIGSNYQLFFSQWNLHYSAGLIGGGLIGYMVAIHIFKITVNRFSWSVIVPGSWIPFAMLLAFFVLKYLLNAYQAINGYSQFHTMLDVMLSAVISGYFLGRAFRAVYLVVGK